MNVDYITCSLFHTRKLLGEEWKKRCTLVFTATVYHGIIAAVGRMHFVHDSIQILCIMVTGFPCFQFKSVALPAHTLSYIECRYFNELYTQKGPNMKSTKNSILQQYAQQIFLVSSLTPTPLHYCNSKRFFNTFCFQLILFIGTWQILSQNFSLPFTNKFQAFLVQ